MFGNLITNDLLARRIKDGSIVISPFSRELAQMAHYPLTPATALRRKGTEWAAPHDFSKDGDTIRLSANEYVLIEIAQSIRLSPGIVGVFVPASNLIEQGLSLVSGKLTSPFGDNGEKLRFGLKNCLDQTTDFSRSRGIAYIQFFDLTGLPMSEYTLSRRDIDVFAQRRHQLANEDGVYSTAVNRHGMDI